MFATHIINRPPASFQFRSLGQWVMLRSSRDSRAVSAAAAAEREPHRHVLRPHQVCLFACGENKNIQNHQTNTNQTKPNTTTHTQNQKTPPLATSTTAHTHTPPARASSQSKPEAERCNTLQGPQGSAGTARRLRQRPLMASKSSAKPQEHK